MYPSIAFLVALGWLLIVALSYRRGVSRPWWPALVMAAAGMVCWNVGYVAQHMVRDPLVGHVTSLLIEASELLAVAAAIHFSASLSRPPTGWRAVVAAAGYLLAVALFLAGHTPADRLFPAAAALGSHSVALAYIVGAACVAVGLQLFAVVRAPTPLDRQRTKYVVLASAVAAAGYAHDLFLSVELPAWSLGNVTAMFCGAVGVHALTGERLVPISTVFRDLRHALAAVVLIGGGYVVLMMAKNEDRPPWLVAIPAAVVTTLYLLFQIRHKLFEIGERLLFTQRYHFRRQLHLFETQISAMDSPREMVARLLELCTDQLGIQHALVIATEEIEPLLFGLEAQSLRGSVVGEHVYAFREVHILRVLEQAKGPIYRPALLRQPQHREIPPTFDCGAVDKMMQRMRCELLLPLTAGDTLLGALGLGERTDAIPYSRDDIAALGELAAHAGLYLENARIQYRAQQADRMASLRRLADRLVQRLRARIETLRETVEQLHPDVPVGSATLADLRRDLAHVHDIVDALRRFAGPRSVKPVRCDIAGVIDRVLKGYHWERWFERITIETELDEHLPPAFADPGQLARALEMVILNACEAICDHTGKVTISAAAELDSTRPHVRIDITDTGPGIKPDNASEIFEPLFSTKSGHFGVGLSVAYALLRQNNCSVSVSKSDDDDGGGATFTIRCPLWATPIKTEQ